MQKLAGFGMECEIDSSALLETKGVLQTLDRRRDLQYGRWFPDGTDSCQRRRCGYGSVCAGLRLPFQGNPFYLREVRD